MTRLTFIGLLDSDNGSVLIFVGLFTSFLAGILGYNQIDIKRIIAYSTCSQVGLMFFSIGILSVDFSNLHFFVHGNFKCLIFLLVGSLLHLMINDQDLRKYGGVFFIRPLESSIFLISSFSVIGVIYSSGFYSKELIIIESLCVNKC
jgi:NADH:ubiquinone oxidoreductase subunit 5 (subunit L)/multisubunit Na+/H+ antiporter MnhA subunit